MNKQLNNMGITRQTWILFGVFVVVVVFGFSFIHYTKKIEAELAQQEAAEAEHLRVSFADVKIIGFGAVVYDATDDKVLFEKAADTARPIASITKSLTALVALRDLGRGGIVTISEDALLPEGDNGFTVGEKFPAGELAKFMLAASSNDAAEALGRAIGFGTTKDFFQAADGVAVRLGLSNMAAAGVRSASGLDERGTLRPTVVSTPREVATLFQVAMNSFPDVFASTTKPTVTIRSLGGDVHEAANTNLYLRSFSGLLAGKTGLTESGGGNLVLAYKASSGHVIITVVLGSTQEGRFTDTIELIRHVDTYFDTHE